LDKNQVKRSGCFWKKEKLYRFRPTNNDIIWIALGKNKNIAAVLFFLEEASTEFLRKQQF